MDNPVAIKNSNVGAGTVSQSTIHQHFVEVPRGKPLTAENVPNAAFNAANKQHMPLCLPGTRHDVLREIRKWADGQRGSVYWMKGMAGTGKTTIALTIATEYHEECRLGASFFFSRQGDSLSKSRGFPATIATQLTKVSAELRDRIGEAFEANSDIHSLGLLYQWKLLVLEPLAKMRHSLPSPLIVVIDALDECENSQDLRLLIDCLASCSDDIQLRFFVTSRPEGSIESAMGRVTENQVRTFVLHDIEVDKVNKDLMEYYRETFTTIEQDTGLEGCLLTQERLDQLVKRSFGLFIYAATTCRFVHEGGPLAEDRLKTLLEAHRPLLSAEAELDQMYRTVLMGSLTATMGPGELMRVQDSFNTVVGCLVALFDTVSVETLATILAQPPTTIMATMKRLHSVLDVPKQHNKPIRILHPSFQDFLLDPSRCGEQFSGDIQDKHRLLLDSCLRIMSINLKQNILRLERPGTRVSQISKLEVTKAIPSHVQYACLHWFLHLQMTDLDPRQDRQILDFFQVGLLFWLEALSCMGRLRDAFDAMDILESIMMKTENTGIVSLLQKAGASLTGSASLSPMLDDAKRFLFSHSLAISQAPLQLYCSALIFSPGNSLTRKQYIHLLPTWISETPSLPKDWNLSFRTIEPKQELERIVYSSNGRFIAILFRRGTLCLYDPLGMKLWETKSHSTPSHGLAFSPTEDLLVTVSKNDGTTRFWDAKTGRETQPRQRYYNPGAGLSYAVPTFSPDGSLIIAAATHEKVQVWYESTGKLQVLACPRSRTAVFSPDGTILAVVSDGGVRLWSLSCDEEIWDHQARGPIALDGELEVAFSPDGKLLATNNSFIIRLYDAATGVKLRTIDEFLIKSSRFLQLDELGVGPIAFSSDGELLVAASACGKVGMWKTKNGSRKWLHHGDSGDGNAIAFSPDGRLMIIAMGDNSVKFCDMSIISRAQQPLRGLPSVKCEYMITVSRSREIVLMNFLTGDGITVWNTKTGIDQRLLEPESVLSAVLSPNEKTIATVSYSRDSPPNDTYYMQFWSAENYAMVGGFGFQRRHDQPEGVALSHDGDLAAVVTIFGDVQVMEMTTGMVRWHFQLEPDSRIWISFTAFSPDDKEISILYNGTAEIWDIAEGTKRLTLAKDSGAIHALDYSPDGKLVATASEGDVTIWHADSGRIFRVIKVPYPPRHVSFTPQGTELLTDSGIYHISAAKGQPLHGLFASGDWITEDGEDLVFVPSEYLNYIACIVGQDVRFVCSDEWTSLKIESFSKLML